MRGWADTNANPHGRADTNGNTDGDANTHPNGGADTNGNTDSDADPVSTTTSGCQRPEGQGKEDQGQGDLEVWHRHQVAVQDQGCEGQGESQAQEADGNVC